MPMIMMTRITIIAVMRMHAVEIIVMSVTRPLILVTVIITVLCMLILMMGVLVLSEGISIHCVGM